jgi:hypothetical protein
MSNAQRQAVTERMRRSPSDLEPTRLKSKTGAPQHLLGIAGPLDLDSRGHRVDLIEIVGGKRDRERP